MDIVKKNTTNKIYCNISNETEYDYYTLIIEAEEYNVSTTLVAPYSVNERYVEFTLIDGEEDLSNATIDLPNNGDFPYIIMNTNTVGCTSGIEIHRGILRLKEPREIVYSYTDDQDIVIYE